MAEIDGDSGGFVVASSYGNGTIYTASNYTKVNTFQNALKNIKSESKGCFDEISEYTVSINNYLSEVIINGEVVGEGILNGIPEKLTDINAYLDDLMRKCNDWKYAYSNYWAEVARQEKARQAAAEAARLTSEKTNTRNNQTTQTSNTTSGTAAKSTTLSSNTTNAVNRMKNIFKNLKL